MPMDIFIDIFTITFILSLENEYKYSTRSKQYKNNELRFTAVNAAKLHTMPTVMQLVVTCRSATVI